MRAPVRTALAVASTATLLFVAVDYTTYAATGDSLVLGRSNHAGTTTKVVKHAAGPALRLVTDGQRRPSLAVSSRAKVYRLNADMLDGRSAAILETRAVTYRAGSALASYPGMALWRVPVKPGLYAVSFRAFLVPDSVAPGETVGVICGLADLNTLANGQNTHVYTAESGRYVGGEDFPVLMSGAETVRVSASAAPGIVCTTSPTGSFTLFAPVASTWTRINHRSFATATPVAPPMARQQLGRLFSPGGR